MGILSKKKEKQKNKKKTKQIRTLFKYVMYEVHAVYSVCTITKFCYTMVVLELFL